MRRRPDERRAATRRPTEHLEELHRGKNQLEAPLEVERADVGARRVDP